VQYLAVEPFELGPRMPMGQWKFLGAWAGEARCASKASRFTNSLVFNGKSGQRSGKREPDSFRLDNIGIDIGVRVPLFDGVYCQETDIGVKNWSFSGVEARCIGISERLAASRSDNFALVSASILPVERVREPKVKPGSGCIHALSALGTSSGFEALWGS